VIVSTVGADSGLVEFASAAVEDRRTELRAMARRLAATAESAAAVMEGLARLRDRLADNSRSDPGPMREGPRRAREFAAAERREAERLHAGAAAAARTAS
jgi:hypothetical protein